MKPVSPVVPGENFPEIVVAKDQNEYQNLPAIVVNNDIILTRWRLSLSERLRMLFSGNILSLGSSVAACSIGDRQTETPQFGGSS